MPPTMKQSGRASVLIKTSARGPTPFLDNTTIMSISTFKGLKKMRLVIVHNFVAEERLREAQYERRKQKFQI